VPTPKFWSGFGNLREAFYLVWSEASGFGKIRLIVALLLITVASVLTGLGPVALSWSSMGSRAASQALQFRWQY
jgi:hypothetical protein